MVAISEQTIDKVLHISDEQIPLLTNFVDELINNDVSSIDVSNRIGIAKDIVCNKMYGMPVININ